MSSPVCSLLRGLRLSFCQAVTLSDVTVIVSPRNIDMNLMHTKWHQMNCERRSAWWNRKLWVAAFFIFQGPSESLMFYTDALHCNYRSCCSLLTVLPFLYKILLFYPNHKPGFSWNIKQDQNCGDSTYCALKCAQISSEREPLFAVPHLITPADSWKALTLTSVGFWCTTEM